MIKMLAAIWFSGAVFVGLIFYILWICDRDKPSVPAEDGSNKEAILLLVVMSWASVVSFIFFMVKDFILRLQRSKYRG